MQTVNLGRTGLKVTRICLGCMSYGTQPWADWVLRRGCVPSFSSAGMGAGINFYDTADVYSSGTSEEVLGRALRELKIPREQVIVATKVNGAMGPSPNERGLSASTSARHRRQPPPVAARLCRPLPDPSLRPDGPIEETLAALDDVVKAGKALHIGASSMYAWQMAKMLHTSDRLGSGGVFATMQIHYNRSIARRSGRCDDSASAVTKGALA
jgi:aryl-alcohol dehydrogenase (NADP+)